MERMFCRDLRFEARDLRPVDPLETHNTILTPAREQVIEDRLFPSVRCDDQLSETLCLDPLVRAPCVESLPPTHAQFSFEASGRVVEACVNDFAVSTGNATSDA